MDFCHTSGLFIELNFGPALSEEGNYEMETTVEEILVGLCHRVEYRFLNALNQQHGGAVTHPKPMDTTAERYIFDSNARLGTISLSYDCMIRHWDGIIECVRCDEHNIVIPFIKPPMDTRSKEMVSFSNGASLQCVLNFDQSLIVLFWVTMLHYQLRTLL